MFDLTAYLWAFLTIFATSLVTWLVSLIKRDVSIVDALWSIMFVIAAVTYAITLPEPGPRTALILVLVTLWALRLSAYITWRNWGESEDHRYQAIRRNNEAGFAFKSLYIVFGLQGVLAWVISLPLLAAVATPAGLNAIDFLGIGLWSIGILFEAGGDVQLARFKAKPENRGQVMDRGLWRYTRHPNYFGNFCIWWGFYLVALAGGGWWAIISPMLMTFLLLRVSGVALLEQDIGDRRPAYRDYIARTNAFFPGPPRQTANRFQRSSQHG